MKTFCLIGLLLIISAPGLAATCDPKAYPRSNVKRTGYVCSPDGVIVKDKVAKALNDTQDLRRQELLHAIQTRVLSGEEMKEAQSYGVWLLEPEDPPPGYKFLSGDELQRRYEELLLNQKRLQKGEKP